MKRLFYAFAAILCIVLAYHIGATNAQGQGLTSIRFLGNSVNEGPYVAIGGSVWLLAGDHWMDSRHSWPVPVDQIVAYTRNAFDTEDIVTTTGEGFQWSNDTGGHWISRGFPPSGPVGAIKQTWGQVKARYH